MLTPLRATYAMIQAADSTKQILKDVLSSDWPFDVRESSCLVTRDVGQVVRILLRC
jgi:hypothetical protein